MSSSGKTIILAFDGTSNQFGSNNTNVIRLFSLLEKDHPDIQILYYQPGIGTYLAEGTVWSPALKSLMEVLDKAFARYLDIHIMDGYRYLMRHYQAGDRVCMFGFSRGAYTARCLAGMLRKVGLLLPNNDQLVTSAYERYLDISRNGEVLASGFKNTFCISCPIEFLGVWDTVASVGLITSKHLPLTASNFSVKTFRQALALDERRVKFKPNMWHRSSKVCRRSKQRAPLPMLVAHKTGSLPGYVQSAAPQDLYAVDRTRVADENTDVREVWFAGCHSDVGGGNVPSDIPSLSDPSFAWMVNQLIGAKTPVAFNVGALESLQRFDSYLSWSSGSITRLEQTRPLELGKAYINDHLKKGFLWWIPELFPFKHSTRKHEGQEYERSRVPNFGRPRKIWSYHVRIHESVMHRMERELYRPAARFGRSTTDVKFVNDFGDLVGEGIVKDGFLVSFRVWPDGPKPDYMETTGTRPPVSAGGHMMMRTSPGLYGMQYYHYPRQQLTYDGRPNYV